MTCKYNLNMLENIILGITITDDMRQDSVKYDRNEKYVNLMSKPLSPQIFNIPLRCTNKLRH